MIKTAKKSFFVKKTFSNPLEVMNFSRKYKCETKKCAVCIHMNNLWFYLKIMNRLHIAQHFQISYKRLQQ